MKNVMPPQRQATFDVDVVFRARLGRIGTDFFRHAAAFALEGENIPQAWISIAIVDDQEIRGLNATWLKHDYATDIITFPLEQRPLEAELIVSADTARRQAHEAGVSLREELARLVIHGILHLAGYDDTLEADKKRMKYREDTLVRDFMSWHKGGRDEQLT
jgi:probable rRNA maturation factor